MKAEHLGICRFEWTLYETEIDEEYYQHDTGFAVVVSEKVAP